MAVDPKPAPPRFSENEMAAQVSAATELSLGERLIGVCMALHANRDTRQTVAPVSRLMALTGQDAGYVCAAVNKLSGEGGHFRWLNADTWRPGQGRTYLCLWDGKPRWKTKKRSGNSRTVGKTQSVRKTAKSVREFPEGNSSIEDNKGRAGAHAERAGSSRSRPQHVAITIGSSQWEAWVQHYETHNPQRARLMRHQAENSRTNVWSEETEWPPATVIPLRTSPTPTPAHKPRRRRGQRPVVW